MVERIFAAVTAELLAEGALREAAWRLGTAPEFSPLPTQHWRVVEAEPVMPPDPARAARLRASAAVLLAEADRQRLAELRASDREAEMARAASRAGILQSDPGANGPAMRARPSEPNGIPGSNGRAMLDHDPLVSMGLSLRQAEAASWLRQYWREAVPALALPQGWGNGGHKLGERHLTHAEYLAAREAWNNYQLWMNLIGQDCGEASERAVRSAVILREPVPDAWRVREAMEYLAAHLGIA